MKNLMTIKNKKDILQAIQDNFQELETLVRELVQKHSDIDKKEAAMRSKRQETLRKRKAEEVFKIQEKMWNELTDNQRLSKVNKEIDIIKENEGYFTKKMSHRILTLRAEHNAIKKLKV